VKGIFTWVPQTEDGQTSSSKKPGDDSTLDLLRIIGAALFQKEVASLLANRANISKARSYIQQEEYEYYKYIIGT
jgi:hypothetical protein